MDNMISLDTRHRPPTKRFIRPALDTTDTELEDVDSKKSKKNFSKQPENALQKRLQTLGNSQQRNNFFEAPPSKKYKISVKNKPEKSTKQKLSAHKEYLANKPKTSVKKKSINGLTEKLHLQGDNKEKKISSQSRSSNTPKTFVEKTNQSHSSNISKTSVKIIDDIKVQLPINKLLIPTISKEVKLKPLKDINDNVPGHSSSFFASSTIVSSEKGKQILNEELSLNKKAAVSESLDKQLPKKNKETITRKADFSDLAPENTSTKITPFKKTEVARKQEEFQNLVSKEKSKNSKLSEEVQKYKKLLYKEEEKSLKQQEIIKSLKNNLQEMTDTLKETKIELKKVQELNKKWQNLGVNKCMTFDAVFTKLQESKNVTKDELYPPVGYITNDKSCVHMGRDQWISYETYTLAMNNVSYRTRRIFPRNLCIGVFGYDLLSKSTITGNGSNRNRNTKKPEYQLDPNKLLAIKDLYRHFLVKYLNLTDDAADVEACKVNEIIRRKISSVKELHNKVKKPTKPLLGEEENDNGDPTELEENEEQLEVEGELDEEDELEEEEKEESSHLEVDELLEKEEYESKKNDDHDYKLTEQEQYELTVKNNNDEPTEREMYDSTEQNDSYNMNYEVRDENKLTNWTKNQEKEDTENFEDTEVSE